MFSWCFFSLFYTSSSSSITTKHSSDALFDHIAIWCLQVRILLLELCNIHSCPLPNEIHQLNTFHSTPMASSHQHVNNNGKMPMKNHDELDSDPEEDVVGESDQDSDAEEDLPLELDDGRSANKKDEMEVEHLATLERLRQTQRQDYLRVSSVTAGEVWVTLTVSFRLRVPFREAFKRPIAWWRSSAISTAQTHSSATSTPSSSLTTPSTSGTFVWCPSTPIARSTMICWCWKRKRARTAFCWISFSRSRIRSSRRSFASFIPSYQVNSRVSVCWACSDDTLIDYFTLQTPLLLQVATFFSVVLSAWNCWPSKDGVLPTPSRHSSCKSQRLSLREKLAFSLEPQRWVEKATSFPSISSDQTFSYLLVRSGSI